MDDHKADSDRQTGKERITYKLTNTKTLDSGKQPVKCDIKVCQFISVCLWRITDPAHTF